MAVLGRGKCKGPELGVSVDSDKDPVTAEMLGAEILPGTPPAWLILPAQGEKEDRKRREGRSSPGAGQAQVLVERAVGTAGRYGCMAFG